MRKWTLFMLVLSLSLPGSSVWAQRSDTRGATLASDPPLDTSVIYRLGDLTASGFRDTVTVKFYLVQHQAFDSLKRIDVKVTWTSGDLKYITSRRGPGWPDMALAYSPTTTSTSLTFSRSGFNTTFDSTKAVIEVDFLVGCVDLNGTTDAVFSTAVATDNQFFRDPDNYRPALDDGQITVGGPWPDTTIHFIGLTGSDTVQICDTVKADVRWNCTYPAWGGFKSAWKWTSRLKFIGLETSGTLLEGATIDTSLWSDSLYVETTDTISSFGPDTLFYLVFVDTSHVDNVTDNITNMWDSVFSGCSFLNIGDTSDVSNAVIIPRYSATLDIVDRGVDTGQTVAVTVQLKNNFTVDMGEYQNSHSDSAAAFHIDTLSMSHVTYTRAVSATYSIGGREYYWKQSSQDSSIVFEDDGQFKTSSDIPRSAAKQNVATYNVRGKTAGTDYVGFTRIGTGQTGNKQDSKLKAYNAPIVIYSFTDTGIDSLFKLETGVITVTAPSGGGGGGSCPFVYTWDGAEFKIEDAVLTESEKLPEGTPVTDYLPLTFQPTLENGSYRLRIHEEEAEKTFLDDAQLLVIDHRPGYEASVTTEGDIVFGNGRVHPWGVVDDAGNDVTQLVTAQDDNRFEGHGSGSLTATFNRREGEFYAVAADSTEGEKRPCEVRQGPLGQTKPEPTTVRIEVEDAQGIWHELPSGPMRLPKTRIRPVIDLSGYDLPVMFRIRYSWDGDYSLDEIALAVQVPVEHTVTTALAAGIKHSSDHPSARLAAQADGRYAELVTGEYLDLEFPASPVPEGMERSFVLKTKGYFMQWFGDENAGRPLAFGLNGNYPNPFNPSTTIRYSLASDAVVTLEVFNVLGQRVRTLISGLAHPEGSFEVVWDGHDDQGYAVGSGAYLYRFKAGDYTETRKMIMLK